MSARIPSTRTEPETQSLTSGIPPWMKSSIHHWIMKFTSRDNNGLIPEPDRVLAIERYLQITLGDHDPRAMHRRLIDYADSSEEQGLDVVQAIIATNNNHNITIPTINIILIQSGSRWIAKRTEDSDYYATLEERVDEETELAYSDAASNSNSISAQYMKKAWSSAFSRSPSPSEAYSNAIKAVEAASWSLITPNDNKATLGTILGEMSSHPNKWSTKIPVKQADDDILTVISLLRLLWEGQTDRHGTAAPAPPTQESAEQAVITAVLLCNYFNKGYIA